MFFFSDECRFGLKNDCKTLRVWRTTEEAHNPKFYQPAFNNAISLMFWGCIGPKGVGKLVICDQRLDSVAAMYGEDERPFIFQQDNAPPHRSIFTKIYCQTRGIKVLPWPASSPDLNIIENVWLRMKNIINHDPNGPPITRESLIGRVVWAWHEIPQDYISQFYSSIPRRLKAVLKVRGYPTKY